MKYALINPAWSFEGSVYFGCREPHLPLEYGYSKALLERDGHEVLMVDGQLEGLSNADIRARVGSFDPDFLIVTTAPSYLFWRCAPPELRVPRQLLRELPRPKLASIAVGPHGSTTPGAALKKLEVDLVVMGECEEILPHLNDSVCDWRDGEPHLRGVPHASDMAALPALAWPAGTLARHSHQHHRFDGAALGPGAEMEASRGCTYHGTFCANENFRSGYRRRPLQTILKELDGLVDRGVKYIYFIDPIFLPHRELLDEIAMRQVKFGVQTRIDLWSTEMLELLGRAGCVSMEAAVESISEEGREALDKKCRLSSDELAARLIHAKQFVPFVQGNLIEMPRDDEAAAEAWRARLLDAGVWSNKPAPLFPYPGSPDYSKLWGGPDDRAWERAHEYYLAAFSGFTDVQSERPLPLAEMERQK